MVSRSVRFGPKPAVVIVAMWHAISPEVAATRISAATSVKT
jgi:hypothetical protein